MVESVNRRLRDLDEHRYRNSFLVVLGLTYWFAALLKPGLVATVSPAVSAAGLVVMGALVLGNLLVESRLLWAILGLFVAAGIVSSWVGVTRWSVPYSTGTAAASMALVNAVSAIVLVSKALEER